ncbi:protein of unknown function [Nonlabens sp. Hel1_33_55]|uniref:DUF4268 domain-containing protein n=1 Tax=Nonlabens sp. Hel1_33_55 TaxID=1336802 RepID=UPI000875DCE1|nr:DUF4268 domain-containing protein [Nonlabens sp. Hel1_33_55]SCY00763.1 protein of unknown function [Nonlabens sp. Hel1_33_55]
MFSIEEAKQVRQDFWTFFGKRYHRKWTLYDTKLKDVNLKFSMENNQAIISLDIEHDDIIFRHYYFEKFESFKSVMEDEVSADLIFERDHILESGKVISRIYVSMDNVKITRKTDWPTVYEFFYENMDKLETFFWEYKDFIED